MTAEALKNQEFVPYDIKKELQMLRTEYEKISRKATESQELANLFEALAKAQLDMEVAKTDQTNPFFKSNYADLASIVKASRPFLAKNGLSVAQRIIPTEDGKLHLYTRICHASGQWMESMMPIVPPKNDIQTIGSYITYLRRYNYAAIVGVVASGEDDDGETAMSVPRQGGSYNSTTSNEGKISKAQLQVLSEELENHEEILENLLKGFKIGKLADMPSKKYSQCMQRIREIKRAKEA